MSSCSVYGNGNVSCPVPLLEPRDCTVVRASCICCASWIARSLVLDMAAMLGLVDVADTSARGDRGVNMFMLIPPSFSSLMHCLAVDGREKDADGDTAAWREHQRCFQDPAELTVLVVLESNLPTAKSLTF